MADQSETVAAKVRDTAKEEVKQVATIARDGAKSGAYLYPIKVCEKLPLDETLANNTQGILYVPSPYELYP